MCNSSSLSYLLIWLVSMSKSINREDGHNALLAFAYWILRQSSWHHGGLLWVWSIAGGNRSQADGTFPSKLEKLAVREQFINFVTFYQHIMHAFGKVVHFKLGYWSLYLQCLGLSTCQRNSTWMLLIPRYIMPFIVLEIRMMITKIRQSQPIQRRLGFPISKTRSNE